MPKKGAQSEVEEVEEVEEANWRSEGVWKEWIISCTSSLLHVLPLHLFTSTPLRLHTPTQTLHTPDPTPFRTPLPRTLQPLTSQPRIPPNPLYVFVFQWSFVELRWSLRVFTVMFSQHACGLSRHLVKPWPPFFFFFDFWSVALRGPETPSVFRVFLSSLLFRSRQKQVWAKKNQVNVCQVQTKPKLVKDKTIKAKLEICGQNRSKPN